MTTRILCVDDDSNILLGYQRALRKHFQIEIALGGEEGLAAVRNQGPYAVIVADMRMPGMDGVELLAKVRESAPDTVRMMLTGNADQQTALEAVNQGHIFRFMTKPCSPEDFAQALQAGLLQNRLIVAERELLTKTLSGSVKMLTDVLSLVNPTAFGRASRIRATVHKMAQVLGEDELWMIEIAAMLSQIGCVAIPDDVLARQCRGEDLSRSEREAFAAHPLIGRDLIKNIPRLEGVAEIIAYQEKRFDGSGTPPDERRGKAIPAGSRILKVALDYDSLVSAGSTPEMAAGELRYRGGWYDPDVVAALQKALNITQAHVIRTFKLDALQDEMILAADLKSTQGTLLCAKGTEVTPALRLRLRNYTCNLGLCGPIEVFLPIDAANKETRVLDREQGPCGMVT
jgi:response regulator RpfG family c-di-GMP phosphodiesterase